MKTDLYTKIVLSIIALVLSLNLLAEFNFISKAYAKSENFIKPNFLSIPVNEDGSINVKLSKSDIDIIKPQSIQNVDIRKVSGWNLATYEAYERDGETFNMIGVYRP